MVHYGNSGHVRSIADNNGRLAVGPFSWHHELEDLKVPGGKPMPVAELPNLLTIDQLAVHLGVTPRHVRRLISERRLPFLKVGRLVRFDPKDIAQWLDGSRLDPCRANVPGR